MTLLSPGIWKETSSDCLVSKLLLALRGPNIAQTVGLLRSFKTKALRVVTEAKEFNADISLFLEPQAPSELAVEGGKRLAHFRLARGEPLR